MDFLGDFFEVAINMILYTREVYPESREKTIISSINNLYLISNFHKSQAFQCMKILFSIINFTFLLLGHSIFNELRQITRLHFGHHGSLETFTVQK